jgi:sodium/bile acid cotransporter 7
LSAYRDQWLVRSVISVKYLNKVYIDGFVLGIVGCAALASVFPAQGTMAAVVDQGTKIAIGLLFLLYGARLEPREAIAGLRHWRLHAVVLSVTFIVFPLIGLALRMLVPSVLTNDLYTGVLFMCLVPSTVQASIAFTSIARGNVAGAVVSASLSNLVGVFATPLLVVLLMNTTGKAEVKPSAVLVIMVQLLLPFLVGQLLRPRLRWLLRRPALLKVVDRGSVLLVVYSAFSAGMAEHIWGQLSIWRVLATAAVCAGLLAAVLAMTAAVGKVAGFSVPDRIVLVFCGSKKGLAAGLSMAAVLFAGRPVGLIVLPLMIFHQIQLITCAILAQHFARRPESVDEVVDVPVSSP